MSTDHSRFLPAPIRMTLNDLEYPIHLKVRFTDGTLDVHTLWLLDSTIRTGTTRGGRGGVGWRANHLPLHPCGQLTRCFSAAAELLVLIFGAFAKQCYNNSCISLLFVCCYCFSGQLSLLLFVSVDYALGLKCRIIFAFYLLLLCAFS